MKVCRVNWSGSVNVIDLDHRPNGATCPTELVQYASSSLGRLSIFEPRNFLLTVIYTYYSLQSICTTECDDFFFMNVIFVYLNLEITY